MPLSPTADGQGRMRIEYCPLRRRYFRPSPRTLTWTQLCQHLNTALLCCPMLDQAAQCRRMRDDRQCQIEHRHTHSPHRPRTELTVQLRVAPLAAFTWPDGKLCSLSGHAEPKVSSQQRISAQSGTTRGQARLCSNTASLTATIVECSLRTFFIASQR